MSALDEELLRRLNVLAEQNLHRKLRRVSSPQQPRLLIDGREFLNFSSNDYLGLATHPKLKEAAIEAVERHGAGSGASRLISGSLKPHYDLEEALAAFKKTEAALVFSTGYATALGTITALMSPDDIIILDKLVHASIVDAARLSGARLRVFKHNDLDDLAGILDWSTQQRAGNSKTSVLIVTESVFSMDGDAAPLAGIVSLKEKHGAWLMIDEAHATGLFGPNRRGLAEEFALSDRIEIQMGTLGKALGSSGGYIAGSRALIDFLINKARSFIFSTAPVPAASAAARQAIQIVQSDEGELLLASLRSNIAPFCDALGTTRPEPLTPIIPWLIGSETEAVDFSERLRQNGIFVPAIRFPTVARGKARLRFTLSAAHRREDIERAVQLLAALKGS